MMNIRRRQFCCYLAALLAGITFATRGQNPPVPPPAAPPATSANQGSVGPIEFQGASVNAVVDYYSRLTNRSVISQPNLPGTIYFRAQTALTKDEAIGAIESVLAINGIGIVPLGDKFMKVVQIAGAKQEGVGVGVLGHEGSKGVLPAADTLVTQIIPLKFADVAEIVAALQPYMHAYGQLLPLAKSNSLLITETAGNIKQMLEIVRYVDQPSQLRMETKIYVLQNARAADVVQQLQGILQQTEQIGVRAAAPGQPPVLRRPGQPPVVGGQAGVGAESVVEGKVVITPDARTNKLFLLSRSSNFDFFDRLIAELDAKVEPEVLTRVIGLQYASAEDIAALLSSLVSGAALPAKAKAAKPGAPAAPPPPPSAGGAAAESSGLFEFAEGVRVLPDTRTNSLLVMASKHDLERIEELVRNMDTAVAQVVIEVVIAEVNLDNTMELSVNAIKRKFGGDPTSAGASLNRPGDPIDVSSLATNLANVAGSGLTWWMSLNNLKLDAIIRALATSTKFKILSTPIIQTLHNQEATIIVGESRPVITSSVVDQSNLSTTRSNVEYKDIAIELVVTPRINPDGRVTMDINQKINDLGGEVLIDKNKVPIITKREAKSSVAVKDGSTIVLGGLIRESKNISETKTPILGDIPFFGMLFKGKSTEKIRSELIVFIRPTVMRTDAEAVAEAARRANLLRSGKELELDKVVEGKAIYGSTGDTEKKKPAATGTNQAPVTATEPKKDQ